MRPRTRWWAIALLVGFVVPAAAVAVLLEFIPLVRPIRLLSVSPLILWWLVLYVLVLAWVRRRLDRSDDGSGEAGGADDGDEADDRDDEG